MKTTSFGLTLALSCLMSTGSHLRATAQVQGTSRSPSQPKSEVPFIYVLNYGPSFFESDEAFAPFAQAPPDLLHLGKTVPITHLWGPVHIYWNENQSTAYPGNPGGRLYRENIRLLSPAEVEARIARMKAMTEASQRTGIKMITPYLCSVTIAGDHESGQGFWEFYGKWDEYARWLGPRPGTDPSEWIVKDREGNPAFHGVGYEFSPKYFAPLHRYRACVTHPDWRAFQLRLVRLVAEAGFDGVFMDNSSGSRFQPSRPGGCFCQHCQTLFKDYVAGLSPLELATCGIAGDPAALDLRETESEQLLKRFANHRIGKHLQALRDEARKINPAFKIFPNINRYDRFVGYGDTHDYYMLESVYAPGATSLLARGESGFLTMDVVPTRGVDVDDRTTHKVDFARTPEFPAVEMTMELNFPNLHVRGEASEFVLQVIRVGGSSMDDDYARDFQLHLHDVDAGRQETLVFTPEVVIGRDPQGLLGPEHADTLRQAPVELRATWVPQEVGKYRVTLVYLYTDAAHLHTTRDLEVRNELKTDDMYRTHIGQLLYSRHASAKLIVFGGSRYGHNIANTCELWVAELAAFSNGAPPIRLDESRDKYRRFFQRSAHLYDGFEPQGDIGLLYGYWGNNPNEMGAATTAETSPADELAAAHRLFRVYVDKTFGEGDLAGLKTLVICTSVAELGEKQMAALERFRQAGGTVCIYRPETTIGGRPWREVLAGASLWDSGANVPGNRPVTVKVAGHIHGLRFAAYRKDAAKTKTLHVVNYNVLLPGGKQAGQLVEVQDIPLSVSLPRDWRIKAVRAHDPDIEAVEELEFTIVRENLELTLPNVRIYKVLEIVAE